MSEILAITLDLGREVQTQPIRFKNLFQNPFQTAVNDIQWYTAVFEIFLFLIFLMMWQRKSADENDDDNDLWAAGSPSDTPTCLDKDNKVNPHPRVTINLWSK